MKPFLIGLWGPAGVGKDSVADALGWPKASFSASLKADLKPLFDSVGIDLNDREQKEKVRPIMVATGHCLRAINPFHWIRRLAVPEGHRAIVCDVRYLNEVQFVLFRGGIVYEIRRPGFEPVNDEERTSFAAIRKLMDDLKAHLPVIHNTTPQLAAQTILEDLAARVVSIRDAAQLSLDEVLRKG